MRHALLSFIILSGVLYSHCAPVPLRLDFSKTEDYAPGKKTKTYHDDSPEVKRLEEAQTLANEQIDAMHTIVNDYGNKEHKAILNEHFGEHHNIDAIKKSVTLLKKGKVNVGAVSDAEIPEYVSAHTYMEPPQSIWFGPHFHSPKRTTQDTAGTILHEASHALLQTGDRYKRVGKGEDAHLVGIWINEYNELEKDKEQRKHLVRGYIDAGHIEELKKDKNMGSLMHMNADTWKAFGASAHDHVMKTQAKASGSGSGAGSSAPKRTHPDSDREDKGKKQKISPSSQLEPVPSASGSSYNRQGTRFSERLKLKEKPHV